VELPHLRQGVFECLGGSCARQWVEILVCCHGEGLEDGSIGRQGKGERDLGSRQSDVEQDYASRKNSRYCAVIWSNSIVYTIAARFLLSQWICTMQCRLHFRDTIFDFQKGSVRASLVKEATSPDHITSVQAKHDRIQHNQYSTTPPPNTHDLRLELVEAMYPSCLSTDTPTGLE